MKHWPIALLLALTGLPAIAGEAGYTLRDTELRPRPFLDTKPSATLAPKTPVEVLTRQGGWMEIRSTEGTQRGWVRMLNVRLGDPNRRPAGGNILSAIGIGSRARPQTTATVTTGVRGFSEEDLKNAKPDPEEVRRLEGFAAEPAALPQFVAEGKLKAAAVPYVDDEGKALEVKK
jgi:hypothetical protein